MKPPETKKEIALYRCKLSCKLGKDSCQGKGIPIKAEKNDWVMYHILSAIEDLAIAMEDKE